MSTVQAVTVPLAAEDRDREQALRSYFARFWREATDDSRSQFDTFISATPAAEGVSRKPVENAHVRGWWVRPPDAEPGSVILYVHGGGYVAGSAKAYGGFASQIAVRARRSVFVLDYPLAPEATVPAAPNAAIAAYEWLVANHCQQISVVGDSAGGGIALVAVSRLALRPRMLQPASAVLFSPWVDLALTGASMKDPKIEDPLLSYEYLKDAARKVLGRASPHDPLASPLYGDLSHLPPLLIQVGADERLLDDARRVADRANTAGSRVRLEIWQGMHHVFQLDVAHLRTSGLAVNRATAFLADPR